MAAAVSPARGPGVAVPVAAPTAAPAFPASRAAPAQDPREKKTTDLTPAAAAAAESEAGAVESEVSAATPAVQEVERATHDEEPLTAWQAAAEAVGGLVADFAAMARRAAWRDGVLEIGMPHAAGQAASFLGRPEVAANLARSLSEARGRPVRPVIVVDPPTAVPVAQAASEERPRAAASQAALVREVLDHPLVARARSTFDAAIRKVEPPRPRPTPAPVAAGVAGLGEAAEGIDQAGESGGDDTAGSIGAGAGGSDG
jgi:hypothetical protein